MRKTEGGIYQSALGKVNERCDYRLNDYLGFVKRRN